MKKFYIAFILCPYLAMAQFSENFDASPVLPATWATYRGTNGLGTLQDWKISSLRSHSPNNAAYIQFEPNLSSASEDWLVTPALNFSRTTGNSISFYGGQQFPYFWGTVYTVRVSVTSQTNISSFTTVATYYEGDFTDLTANSALTSYNDQFKRLRWISESLHCVRYDTTRWRQLVHR